MGVHVDFASSSEDEFPDLDTIYERSRHAPRPSKLSTVAETSRKHQPLERNGEYEDGSKSLGEKSGVLSKSDGATVPSTVRRRKLGQRPNNPLLMPLGSTGKGEGQDLLKVSMQAKRERRDGKRELRTHQVTWQTSFPPRETDGESDSDTHEATEITAEISEHFGEELSMSEDGDTPVFSGREEPTSNTRHFSKSWSQQQSAPRAENRSSGTSQTKQLDFPNLKFSDREKPPQQTVSKDENVSWTRSLDASQPQSTPVDLTDETTDGLRRLKLATKNTRVQEKENRDCNAPKVTPPSTPPKQSIKGLLSPSIPQTPHGPGMDLFWSQEFVDEWNEEHSPKKLILPPAQKSPTKSKVKFTTKAGSTKQKETRKAFKQKKHELAQAFLQELDQAITHGRLQYLAEPTGGVKINWSSKLNTTAGRANWRRETVRSKLADGTEECVTHRHHASIELAEKVIDDEHRLLNVVAHEFCHLANFMVNGITGNPHGKEFKVWAAKCSQEFGSRGIEVTTKHSYEIDFKYVWECIECGLEYKRHSKSINPERHRCGSCKAHLKQTKPVPRATGKTSEYQKFFKEQMKLIREEHPKSPQKEIMKIIAAKWAKRSGGTCATSEMEHATPISVADLDKVGIRLNSLSL